MIPVKVVLVEREQAPFTVRKHGRHDIRIVDLTSGNRNLTTQRYQHAGINLEISILTSQYAEI